MSKKVSSIPIPSAYDILAFALRLKPHPTMDNFFTDKNDTLYRRTRWGFEKAERYNVQLALRRKEKQYDELNDELHNLHDEFAQLLKRKTGLLKHIEQLNQQLKNSRREKGFLKKHLKEVLDKNLSIDKRMERMTNQEDNLLLQIEKLKKTKDNLLEHNLQLTDKNRQQKNQINALQKALLELKGKRNEESVQQNSLIDN